MDWFKSGGLGENDILIDLATDDLVRVLYVSEENNAIALIRLNSNAEMPFWTNLDELCDSMEKGDYAKADDEVYEAFDPDINRRLTSAQRNFVERLSPVFRRAEAAKPDCFLTNGRRELLSQVASITGKSIISCRRIVHNYWARGGGDYALVPQFHKRGRKPFPTKHKKVGDVDESTNC